jgi:tetratricopeptide (TPR) repeat protein
MKNRIGNFVFIFFVLMFSLNVCGQQKYKLANEYYNSGEYEKAAKLYEDLYKENPKSKVYFNWYIQCLIDLKSYDDAQKIVSQELKKSPDDVSLYVTNGNLLERQGFIDKSEAEYRKAIDKLDPDPTNISNLANNFTNLAKYDLAIETFLKGEKLAKIENLFVYNLADLYRRQGDVKNMIKYYLTAAEMEQSIQNIQTSLQRYITDADYVELQRQLYQKIQEKPENNNYGELLQWTFIHKKEFDKALRQAKSMDRLSEGNGSRVYNVAEIAFNENDFNTAIDAYNHIVTQKDRNSSYYFDAKRGLLNSKKAKVTQTYNYTKEDLIALKFEYVSFLNEMGRNTQTAKMMQEFADFEALYVNELDTAILILEELRSFGGLTADDVARAKLSLGDYYLMSGERWEASLLYSQVDKDFKEGFLGELARYRNAKLSYYSGDFEWAQEQFKILKAATSKLISNDAIDMAVFILDNLGLDTTEITMQMYAQADLLSFQHKYEEAIVKLDSINIIFPEHTLADDILFTKAKIYQKQLKKDLAINMYETIIEKFKEEIRADNAIYELALLYLKLGENEKAKLLFEKLFLEYSGSTFAVDARNKFRMLRGDEL